MKSIKEIFTEELEELEEIEDGTLLKLLKRGIKNKSHEELKQAIRENPVLHFEEKEDTYYHLSKQKQEEIDKILKDILELSFEVSVQFKYYIIKELMKDKDIVKD